MERQVNRNQLLSRYDRPRQAMFADMAAILANRESDGKDSWESRWVSRSVAPKGHQVTVRTLSDTCIFKQTLGDHRLSFPVSIRIGEVRIGAVIPKTIRAEAVGGYPIDWPMVAQTEFPFHLDGPNSPTLKAVPLFEISDLIELTYAGVRFGSDSLTIAALQGDEDAQMTLVDGVVHDLLLLSHAITDYLARTGFVVIDGIMASGEEVEGMSIESEMDRESIAKYFDVDPVRIYSSGGNGFNGTGAPEKKTYFVTTTVKQTDDRARIEALMEALKSGDGN